jgi:hypothetical protein
MSQAEQRRGSWWCLIILITLEALAFIALGLTLVWRFLG